MKLELAIVKPPLDKLARFKKTPIIRIRLLGVCMFFLPLLLFLIGSAFGYNVIYPPGQKAFPSQFEAEPGFPVAFLFSVMVGAFSPFPLLLGKKWITVILLTIVILALLVIQILFVILLGNWKANNGQLFHC